MIKITADNLKNRLFSDEKIARILVDDSELARKERELLEKPIVTKQDLEELTNPSNSELKAYMKSDHLGFWWMDLPGHEGFVVGGTSGNWLVINQMIALLGSVLRETGIKELLVSTYHHGSNEGDVFVLTLDPAGIIKYPELPGEQEAYEIYSARVAKEVDYPILGWHEYVSGPGVYFIPWKYSVHYRKKEEMNQG